MDLGNDTCIFKPLTLHPKPRFRAEVEPVEIGVHDFAGLRAVRTRLSTTWGANDRLV
jgi:hypothetical protein